MVTTDSDSHSQLNQRHQEMASFRTICSSHCLRGKAARVTASRKVRFARSLKWFKVTSNSLQCTECGKTFNRKGILMIHNRGHTGDKLHKCDKCGKLFLLKSASVKAFSRTHETTSKLAEYEKLSELSSHV